MVTFCTFFKDDPEQNFAQFSKNYPVHQVANLAKNEPDQNLQCVERKKWVGSTLCNGNNNLKNLQSMTRKIWQWWSCRQIPIPRFFDVFSHGHHRFSRRILFRLLLLIDHCSCKSMNYFWRGNDIIMYFGILWGWHCTDKIRKNQEGNLNSKLHTENSQMSQSGKHPNINGLCNLNAWERRNGLGFSWTGVLKWVKQRLYTEELNWWGQSDSPFPLEVIIYWKMTKHFITK